MLRQSLLLDCNDNFYCERFTACPHDWLIKIPLVMGGWAIWLYSTRSDEAILTIKRAWKRICGTRNWVR